MSDVKRYRVSDLPNDFVTLNAVYENAECVLASDYDAIAAKAAEHRDGRLAALERIAALEASLKATLFVRSAKGLRLTASGERLLNAGLAVESAMNTAAEVGEQPA